VTLGTFNYARKGSFPIKSPRAIIDLTHIPKKAFDDVLSLTKHPVIISHCAVGAVSADLSDEQIKAVAQNGGILGLHFYWTYMAKRSLDGKIADKINVSDLVDHIDYITDLVGIDYVGLGADFFPTHGEWAEFQKAQGTHNIKWIIEDKSNMFDVTQELVLRGYSEIDIQKILGLNFMRICRKACS
jgi:membrane dipeptidase